MKFGSVNTAEENRSIIAVCVGLADIIDMG